MMYQIGPLAAVEQPDGIKGAQTSENTVTATTPRERPELKPFGTDTLAMRLNPRCDDDTISGPSGRPRYGQSMGPKIPVLGD